MSELLVVAGEASGDRAAAAVLARLPGVRAFGMGGGALAREGLELVADLRDVTAMGLGEVGQRALHVGSAWARIAFAAARRKPRAALLVNYTEFNTRLAARLSRRGVRIVWYGAPQIWAWRPGRGAALRAHVDHMAVMLPFEERMWNELGIPSRYVGHPALEDAVQARRGPDARARARSTLSLTERSASVALLPGSRPHEVRRLLPILLDAYERVRRERATVDGRVLVAGSLDDATRAWARSLAATARVELHDVDARDGLAPLLPAFDAALVASGTASLECVLADVVPIIGYRVGWATELGARAFLDVPHVGLPNILLGEEAFPELLQRRCAPEPMAAALAHALDARPAYLARCESVVRALGARASASSEVAEMIRPWLARHPAPAETHAP